MAKKHIFTQYEDNIISKYYLQNYSLDFISEKLNGMSGYLILKRVKQLGLPHRKTSDVYKKSNMEKYGYEFPFQSEDIQQKAKQTFKNKYGVLNPSQLPDWKQKREQTCLERFGETNNSKTKDWLEKHNETSLERFGEINNSKTEKWKEKAYNTQQEHYGSWFLSSNKIKEDRRIYHKNKYRI